MRDFFDAFKGGLSGGETAAGTWRYLEKYGRFSGVGAADDDFSDMGMHNLFRVAEADVKLPGLHHLRVKGTDLGQELVILVGKNLSAREAMLGTFGGADDPFKRR